MATVVIGTVSASASVTLDGALSGLIGDAINISINTGSGYNTIYYNSSFTSGATYTVATVTTFNILFTGEVYSSASIDVVTYTTVYDETTGTTTRVYSDSTVTISGWNIQNYNILLANTGATFIPSYSYANSTVNYSLVYYLTMDSKIQSASISPVGNIYINTAQSVTFTATGIGSGTGYTYQWYVNNSTVSATTNTYTFSSTTAGYYTVYCRVTDGYGFTAQTPTAYVTVYSIPTIGYSLSSSLVEVGQPLQVVGKVSGGSGAFAYSWFVNGAQVNQNALIMLYYPTSVGNGTIGLQVVDNGLTTPATINAGGSSTYTVATFYSPLATWVSPLSTIIAASGLSGNTTATFTATVSGGSGNYKYTWYVDGTQATVISSTLTYSNYVFSSSNSITHGIYCQITDVNTSDVVVSEIASANVIGGLAVSIISSSLNYAVGSQIQLSASVSGGSGNYQYTWYLNGSNSTTGGTVVGSNSPVYITSASKAGVYYYYLTVKDGITGNSATSSVLTITVYSGISVNITASNTLLDTGMSATISSSITGGSGSYSYQWYENGSVVSGGTTSILTVSSSIPAIINVYLSVKDNNTGILFNTAPLSITWVATPSVSIYASPSSVYVNQPYTLVAQITGGVSPYSYQWYIGTTAITGATSQTYTASQSAIGSYSYYVSVKDKYGYSATSNTATVIVNPLSPSLSVTLSSGGVSNIQKGGTITLTAVSNFPSTTDIFYKAYNNSNSWTAIGTITASGTVATITDSETQYGYWQYYTQAISGNSTAISNVLNIFWYGTISSITVSTPLSLVGSLSSTRVVGGGNNAIQVPSGATGNFTVTDGGSVIPAYNIDLIRTIGQASNLRFTTKKAVNIGDLIQFYYFGNCWFIGYAKEVKKNSDMSYDVSAYDGLYDLGGVSFGKLNTPMSVSQMYLYFIGKVNIGNKITGNEITNQFEIDFGGNPVLGYLEQLSTAFLYSPVMDKNNNIMLMTWYGSVTTRSIIENSGGYMVIKKEFDASRKYNYIKVKAITYDTNATISASAGNPSQYGKEVGDGWLYISSSGTAVLSTMANNILTQTANGQWRVRVFAPTRTPWDITDMNTAVSPAQPYVYNITFQDGTTLNNLILAQVEINQNGVYYEFWQYNDTIMDLMTTLAQK